MPVWAILQSANSYYARRIDPEEGFDREYTVTDEMVGQPQQVIVYWIWPNTFAQMEYDNGNLNLIDPAMFSSNQAAYELEDETTITPRAELMSFIAAHPYGCPGGCHISVQWE